MTGASTNPEKPSPKSARFLATRVVLATALGFIIGGVAGGMLASTNLRADAAAAPVALGQTAQVPDFADLDQKVSPAVVSIRVREASSAAASSDDGSPSPATIALGSGFFISEDGYVVTNNHVVADATSFTVVTEDGTEYQARLIGTDKKSDLALLKVDADKQFTDVKFSDDPVRVGDWIMAVGNPFGLSGTVTAGIVSATGREIGSGPDDNYIQIDAPVNRGNSGGPTFNLKGEVIGINTAIYSPSGGSIGIAFAIPASTAEGVIASLKDRGSTLRGWLGVETQSPATAATN